MEKNLKSRIIEFIASKDMSVRRFEIECGLPNAYVSNLRNNITSRRLDAITAKFPELNLQWLMTGEGSMSRNEPVENSGTDDDDIEKRFVKMHMQMLRIMTEFIKREENNAAQYREHIDHLVEECEHLRKQNLELTGMLKEIMTDWRDESKRPCGKAIIE